MGVVITKTEQEWREELTPEQYEVLRRGATERAFTGRYWNAHDDGIYRCAACGAELFSSDTKFDSGTGWPSFVEPASFESVVTETDTSYGMVRTEVMCATWAIASSTRSPCVRSARTYSASAPTRP